MAELSIIVPVYNVEKYIRKCLDSILNQTFSDFELILVDDGSTDSSGKICDEYADMDDRIIVFHRANGGISVARNFGIQYATGNYVAFVDSDDYIASDMYERLISISKHNNADMVKCGYYEFIDDKITGNKTFDRFWATNNSESREILLPLYFEGVLYAVVWNAIYSKKLAKSVIYPEGFINEDNFASPMYLYFANKLVVTDEILYFYRQNPNGLSKNVAISKRPFDILVCYSRLHESLREYGLGEKFFCKKLRKLMGRTIYKLIQTKRFKLYMDKDFFIFVITHLSILRKIKMFYWLTQKRFIIK